MDIFNRGGGKILAVLIAFGIMIAMVLACDCPDCQCWDDEAKKCYCCSNCCSNSDCGECYKCEGEDCDCVYQCEPDNCESCVDGECKVCGGDENLCCVDGVCESCCYDESTGDCEAHNNECRCDPMGLANCTDLKKEWTVGQVKFCWSNCGTICWKHNDEVPCYAWQACMSIADDLDSVCIIDCQYTYVGFCQTCGTVGSAHIVRGLSCSCD